MTSERRVVDDHEDYEGGVEDGECYEQLVEGVAHLLARQDRHRQYISGKTHCTDKRHQNSLDKEKLIGMQLVQSYWSHQSKKKLLLYICNMQDTYLL